MNQNRRLVLVLFVLLMSGIGYSFARRDAQVKNKKITIDSVYQKSNLVPILVIGSGPAGLMSSIYGARGGKDTYLVEGYKPGGLLMDTTEVANWPGETTIQGPEIIDKLRKQADFQNVHFVADQVASIDTTSWPYKVTLDGGDEIHAMTIVIATGASPQTLDVPGEDIYWGSGVTACAVCDAPFFKDEDVVVVGGGDSAVEEAIQLAPFARSITILVRKDRMRAAQSMQKRLERYPSISMLYNVEIKAIVGDEEGVTGVNLYNNEKKETSLFPTTGVFLAIGHIPNSAFLEGAVRVDTEGYVQVQQNRRATSTPGIFAAGDIADRVYRQAGTSAGSGIEAGLDAVQFLDDLGFSLDIANAVRSQFYAPQGDCGRAELHEVGSMEELQALQDACPEKLIFIDFWTETCSSCKQMRISLQELVAEYSDAVLFVSVDADEASDLAQAFGVQKVPTAILVKNGQEKAKNTGFMNPQEIAEFIESALQKV